MQLVMLITTLQHLTPLDKVVELYERLIKEKDTMIEELRRK